MNKRSGILKADRGKNFQVAFKYTCYYILNLKKMRM